MGILSSLRSYRGKWNVSDRQKFSESDLKEIESNEVVPSEFGNSVKLTKTNGEISFIPVSNTSKDVEIGESIDLTKCFVLTLSRTGDDDIYRIEIQ